MKVLKKILPVLLAIQIMIVAVPASVIAEDIVLLPLPSVNHVFVASTGENTGEGDVSGEVTDFIPLADYTDSEVFSNNEETMPMLMSARASNEEAYLFLCGYALEMNQLGLNVDFSHMRLNTVLGLLKDSNMNSISIPSDATTIWRYRKSEIDGQDVYDEYKISENPEINLSPSTGANMEKLELIVGKGGQLDAGNVRYIVDVYYGYSMVYGFNLYSQSKDGIRSFVEPLDKNYTHVSSVKDIDPNLEDITSQYDEEPIPVNFALYTVEEVYYENPYLGFECTMSKRPDVQIEIYELADKNCTTPITNVVLEPDMDVLNAGYKMQDREAAFIVKMLINTGVRVVEDSNVYIFAFTGTIVHVAGDVLDESSRESVVFYSSESIGANTVYMQEYELKDGLDANGSYRLKLTAKNGDDISSKIEKAVIGHYDSLANANSVGAQDVTSIFSTGYYGQFGGAGLDLTVFFKKGVVQDDEPYKMTIKTVEYGTYLRDYTDKPIVGEPDPWIRVTGAEEIPSDKVYIIENGKTVNMDTYYGYGYQTILIDPSVNLSNLTLSPIFERKGNVERIYDEDTNEIVPADGGNYKKDFTKDNQKYTGIIYDDTNRNGEYDEGENRGSRSYHVTFKKQNTNGAELYVFGPQNPDDPTAPRDREVILNEVYEFRHDILIANLGNKELTGLEVELRDAENVKLDTYYTVGGEGNDTLPAFTSVGDTTEYSELPNITKIRLLPDGDGEKVKGTLIIRADGQQPVTITFNGTIPSYKITNKDLVTTDEEDINLRDAVRYIPYLKIITTDNIRQNLGANSVRTTFSLVEGGGNLPDGITLDADTGEIYGLPTAEPGTYTFTDVV